MPSCRGKQPENYERRPGMQNIPFYTNEISQINDMENIGNTQNLQHINAQTANNTPNNLLLLLKQCCLMARHMSKMCNWNEYSCIYLDKIYRAGILDS